jgi:thiol-disulfide isomerase/thioredoxin
MKTMKIGIFQVFAWAYILISCNTGINNKGQQLLDKKIVIQLNGKKYDQLFLQTMLPEPSHMTNIRIFQGQSTDGHKWTFTIPDSIKRMVDNYSILTRPFDFKTKTFYLVKFKGLTKVDKVGYNYVYDENVPILEADFVETKQLIGMPGDGGYVAANDTTVFDGVSRIQDLFQVGFTQKDSELELSMKFRSFPFLDDDKYDRSLAEKDSITKKYPDSYYLMSQFYYMKSAFRNMDDAKKIFDNFSEQNRSTWFGRESGNFIANYKKLYYYSEFEDYTLQNTTSGKLEPMVLDSTKYNLLIFSASWCAPCHALIPALKDVYTDLNPDLQMVYISLDLPKFVESWKKLMIEKCIPWRSLLSAGKVKEVEDKYDAGSIPHMLLVYPDKSVRKIDIRNKEDKDMLYQYVKREKGTK